MQRSAQALGRKEEDKTPEGAEEKTKSKAAGEAPAPHLTCIALPRRARRLLWQEFLLLSRSHIADNRSALGFAPDAGDG